MPVVSVETRDVADAIAIHRRYQTRYWDSLIIATAAHHACGEILSEDLNDGQTYNGRTILVRTRRGPIESALAFLAGHRRERSTPQSSRSSDR